MTENGRGDAAASDPDPTPVSPSTGWQGASRVEQLATWLTVNRSKFTDAALEHAAIAGGYTVDEVREAFALRTAREHERDAMKPIRSRARWAILGAYGIVWVLFAFAYLGRPTTYGAGPLAQGVLTVALLLGLGISALVLRALHPDPERAGRALAILLVVPVVVLLAITGLCLPFVGMGSA